MDVALQLSSPLLSSPLLFQVSLRLKGKLERGRYKILVNYYQPSNTKYTGRIIVESGRSTALSLSFKHCPNVGGCHALGRDKITGMARSLYFIGDADITISTLPKHKIWIVSISSNR